MSTVTQTAAGRSTVSWHEANQRHLLAALERVRVALRRQVAEHRGESVTDARDTEPLPPGAFALDELCTIFGLQSFERDVLMLCAGVELDSSFAALCAEANGDERRPFPTWSLALAALEQPYWKAMTPGAPLRRWRMIEVGVGPALTVSPLRIDERVLHYLTGLDGIDERLAGMIVPVRESPSIVASHRSIADRIAAIWRRPSSGSPPAVIQLCGDGIADMRAISAAASSSLGLRLFALSSQALPAAPNELEMLSRLWQREAALGSAVLLVECDDAESETHARLRQFIDHTSCALIVARRERMRLGHRQTLTLDVPKPTAPEQRLSWNAALGPAANDLNGHVDALVAHFNMNSDAIQRASAEALAASVDGRDLQHALWVACRGQSRPRLEDLAQRIDGHAHWDDLALPEALIQVLREIATQVRHRLTVYERWGFGRAGSRGLGISALFAGTSGTGKTLAAEVLASDLDLDLFRIDLASVVSKYIGETEKNLRRIFDAADQGGAILLFDEADALFGKRSEVKDSHDRYANIEVSYLLQRMEAFRGLAILTTNLRSSLDSAFLRRIRFTVQFPFPDAAQRAEIWQRAFPKQAPTEGVDIARLAQLSIPGGSIRNIALHAAFLAADDGSPIGMHHLLRAARTDYAKMEKALTESEIDGWF